MFLEMSLNESFHKLGEFLGLKTLPLHFVNLIQFMDLMICCHYNSYLYIQVA